jgi:branched-chain amino acid transport system ATP-binding protein
VDLSTRGLARAFQLVSVFPDMTVRETLTVAACSRLGLRWKLFADASRNLGVQEVVSAIAAAFRLTNSLDNRANSLPHGKRKLLDVASAFALHPKVILLDEPTAGVSTADKHGVMETLLSAARELGIGAILLIEHDMDLVRRYSSRIVAMQGGRKIADLPTEQFFADDAVLSVVIGKEAHS